MTAEVHFCGGWDEEVERLGVGFESTQIESGLLQRIHLEQAVDPFRSIERGPRRLLTRESGAEIEGSTSEPAGPIGATTGERCRWLGSTCEHVADQMHHIGNVDLVIPVIIEGCQATHR